MLDFRKSSPNEFAANRLLLNEEKKKVEMRDFPITNVGNALIIDTGGEKLRIHGTLENLSTPQGPISLLLSPERLDLCAAYIPGADIIRIGYQAFQELQRSPDALARIFAHEACHKRFFQRSVAEQKRLVDMACTTSDAIDGIIEKFYSTKFGGSYQGSHDGENAFPELITRGTKSGLRDLRVFRRPTGQQIHIALFVTELFAYLSPFFLSNKESAFREEARAHKESLDSDGFFALLPSVLEAIQTKASKEDRTLFAQLYSDSDQQIIQKFSDALQRAQKRMMKRG